MPGRYDVCAQVPEGTSSHLVQLLLLLLLLRGHLLLRLLLIQQHLLMHLQARLMLQSRLLLRLRLLLLSLRGTPGIQRYFSGAYLGISCDMANLQPKCEMC